MATGGTQFEAVQRGNDALVHRVILILVRKMTSPVLSNAERLKPKFCFTIKGASFAR
jgi:hypothetical protein